MRFMLILIIFLTSCSYVGIRDKTEDYKEASVKESLYPQNNKIQTKDKWQVKS